ncbi:SET domain-containing protein-lysine N-methyltransferase [soil metagenome]
MSTRRIAVRRSPIHGNGVYALVDIPKKSRIIEYVGEVISWKKAMKRHPHDPDNPHHTFFFDIDNDEVIDGGVGGNSSRWINHSCKPNCKADQETIDGRERVFIHAKRDILAGEELFYDYGLVIEGKLTKQLKRDYQCLCGWKSCRGTMLSASKK